MSGPQINLQPAAQPPSKKKGPPLVLILIVAVGILAVGGVATVLFVPDLFVAEVKPPPLPRSSPNPLEPLPPVPQVPMPAVPNFQPPSPPPKPSAEVPANPAPSEPESAGVYRPFKKVPYTNDLLTVPENTTPTEAFQKFCDHYGENRVVRVVFKFADGGPPAQTAEWLKRTLPQYVPGGYPPAVFVGVQGNEVLGIVAPVREIACVREEFFWGKSPHFDYPRRTLSITLTAAEIPPAAGSPEEATAIEALVTTIGSESRHSAPRRDAIEKLVRFHSPAAAEALLQLAFDMLEKDQISGIMDFEYPLRRMRTMTAERLLAAYQKNEAKKDSVLALSFLDSIGDDSTISMLEPYLEAPVDNPRAEARPRFAGGAIDAIRSRLAKERAEEEKARAEDEAALPAPISPDVVVAVKARDFADEFAWDQSAAAKKYRGQVVEVTGQLMHVGHSFKDEPQLTLKTNLVFGLACKTKDPFPWRELAPGQTVVIKGKVSTDFSVELTDCEVLKSEGPKAIRPTPAQLGARYQDLAKAEENAKKDKGRWVQTTGTICLIEEGGHYFQLETGVECKVRVYFGSISDEKRKELKVGQTLSVLGQLAGFDSPPFHRVKLEDCVLCEPPSGP